MIAKNLQPSSRWRPGPGRLATRFLQWWFFGIGIAIVPLVANTFFLWFRGERVSESAVLGTGNLLLVTVAVGSPPLGLLLISRSRSTAKLVAGGCALVEIVLAALLYAYVASIPSAAHPHSVGEASLYLFALMVATGTACFMAIGEEDL